MKLLFILIKERNLKWPEVVARCAEKFTSMNARSSSGFLNRLAELLVDELETRSQLYNDNLEEASAATYEEFIKSEEDLLRKGLVARFGKTIPGQEGCEVVREKYMEILSTRKQPKPKPPIGFNQGD